MLEISSIVQNINFCFDTNAMANNSTWAKTPDFLLHNLQKSKALAYVQNEFMNEDFYA